MSAGAARVPGRCPSGRRSGVARIETTLEAAPEQASEQQPNRINQYCAPGQGHELGPRWPLAVVRLPPCRARTLRLVSTVSTGIRAADPYARSTCSAMKLFLLAALFPFGGAGLSVHGRGPVVNASAAASVEALHKKMEVADAGCADIRPSGLPRGARVGASGRAHVRRARQCGRRRVSSWRPRACGRLPAQACTWVAGGRAGGARFAHSARARRA